MARACWLYRPRLRQQAFWTAGGVVYRGLRFDLALCRDKRAKRVAGLALMGKVHFASAEAKADIQSWRYYLQYGLPYGIGLWGLAMGSA